MSDARRAQWRAARARARERARLEGRCIGCLRTRVRRGRVTCSECGQRANAAKSRRVSRLRSSAVAQAEAFGIDIVMLLRNVRMSADRRFASLEQILRDAQTFGRATPQGS